MFAALDLRWLTALCQLLLGLFFICMALRVWWMPLGRRASLFGPYLTDKGLRFMLNAWPLVFVLGLFLLVTGVSKGVYYERWHGGVSTETANAIGLVEALFSLWATCSVAVVAVRAWRGH